MNPQASSSVGVAEGLAEPNREADLVVPVAESGVDVGVLTRDSKREEHASRNCQALVL